MGGQHVALGGYLLDVSLIRLCILIRYHIGSETLRTCLRWTRSRGCDFVSNCAGQGNARGTLVIVESNLCAWSFALHLLDRLFRSKRAWAFLVSGSLCLLMLLLILTRALSRRMLRLRSFWRLWSLKHYF